MSIFPTSAFPLFGETDTPLISLPTTTATSLLIPAQHSPTAINTSYLIPPLSPSTPHSPHSLHSPSSDSASSIGYSSGSASPICSGSDSEDFALPMDQLDNVKRLLRMFPPPLSANEFITKNSFKATDGHIKRPSNNFILFRKIAHDQKNQTSDLSIYNEREFSKIIGKIWDGLTEVEKTTYKTLGKEVADMHKLMYPEYKYQPKRDRAAWKHFNPENNNSHQKPKRKNNKIKQQKHQETTPEISKINNVNLPSQQEQIISESTLDYTTLPVEQVALDQMYYNPYPTNNTYTTNNTYIDDNLFNECNEWTTNGIWNINNMNNVM